jgi:hypothetical protein
MRCVLFPAAILKQIAGPIQMTRIKATEAIYESYGGLQLIK